MSTKLDIVLTPEAKNRQIKRRGSWEETAMRQPRFRYGEERLAWRRRSSLEKKHNMKYGLGFPQPPTPPSLRLESPVFSNGLRSGPLSVIRLSPQQNAPRRSKGIPSVNEKRTTKLWLRNFSRYPTEEVWPLFEAAYEVAIRNNHGKPVPRILLDLFNSKYRRAGRYKGIVHVREGKGLQESGTWNSVRGAYEEPLIQWNRIKCRIGKPSHWPFLNETYYRFKDMDVYPVNDYREGIIHIIAHEMQHAFGSRKGKEGEIQCELAAQDAIDHYRKNREKIDMEIKARMAVETSRTESRKRKEEQKRRGPSTEEKAERVMKQIATWTRKRKLADTKIRKYERELRRLSKQMEKELETIYAKNQSQTNEEIQPSPQPPRG